MMDKHYMMYDDVVRVPLIARFPGRIEPGTVRDDFVIHELDLYATFLAAAGLEVPDSAEGVDLLAGAGPDSPGATGREDAFSQYLRLPVRAVPRRGWSATGGGSTCGTSRRSTSCTTWRRTPRS